MVTDRLRGVLDFGKMHEDPAYPHSNPLAYCLRRLPHGIMLPETINYGLLHMALAQTGVCENGENG